MKKSESVPKHRRVFELLRHEILIGKYDDRERFPSEQMLVRRFAVSRPTVNRALLDLKREGLLHGRSGSGTYLSDLARSNAGYLGLIIPDTGWNRFFAALGRGIEKSVREEGYTLLKETPTGEDDATRAKETVAFAEELSRRRVRGVLFEPFDSFEGSREATERILAILKAARIPVALLDRDIVPLPLRSGYDLVGIDNFRAGYVAAEHLIGHGARTIHFFTMPNSADATLQRAQGAAQAVIEHGMRWTKRSFHAIEPTDRRAIAAIFRRSGAPDAVVCRNDHYAAVLIQTLAALRIKVPRRVRVIGFDDMGLAEILSPPLTTLRQPAQDIGRVAVETLLRRLRNPTLPTCRILLDASLTVRESTK